jgi:hypothetical protein
MKTTKPITASEHSSLVYAAVVAFKVSDMAGKAGDENTYRHALKHEHYLRTVIADLFGGEAAQSIWETARRRHAEKDY